MITTATITNDNARELARLRRSYCWSWYELSNKYGITCDEARAAYDAIMRGDSIPDAEAVALVAEWEDLDPYGYHDALMDYAGGDPADLIRQVEADPDGLRNLLAEIREDLDEDISDTTDEGTDAYSHTDAWVISRCCAHTEDAFGFTDFATMISLGDPDIQLCYNVELARDMVLAVLEDIDGDEWAARHADAFADELEMLDSWLEAHRA